MITLRRIQVIGRIALAAAVVLAVSSAIPRAASPTYTAIDLGTLGGKFSEAWAISPTGQVVGGSTTATGAEHAFSWTRSDGMIDLGTLGGTHSVASAVSPTGQVVGASDLPGDTVSHVFSWTPAGGMIDLGTLGGPVSYGYLHVVYTLAVNASGQVVGTSDTADGSRHAFSWTSAGGMIDLGTLGGNFSTAEGLTPSGQVVGSAGTAGNSLRAFSWTATGGLVDLGTLPGGTWSGAVAVTPNGGQIAGYANTATDLYTRHAFSWTQAGGMVNLGTLGGRFSSPIALSPTGQVVGSSTTIAGDAVQHAFSWTQSGGMIDLGTLGGSNSYALGVNASGRVVGYSQLAGDQSEGAFYWAGTGGLVALGTLGGNYTNAYAINDAGQIIGGGTTAANPAAWHAFVWTLDKTPAEEVADLIAAVKALHLKPGIEGSLNAKLNAAFASLASGSGAACNQLAAFINEVKAQAGKGISAADATALISAATGIRDGLGCR